MKNRKPTIGTVISATHRPQDLIPAFLWELAQIDKEAERKFQLDLTASKDPLLFFECIEDDDPWWNSEDAAYAIEDLLDALDEHSPPYCYFGAHEGDGSDFGFWVSIDAVEQAMNDGEILDVPDLCDVPSSYLGDVCIINDHGNMSVGRLDEDGDWYEYWSIV